MEKKFNIYGEQLREVTMIVPEEIMNFLRQYVLQHHYGKTEDGMLNGLADDLQETLSGEQRMDWLDNQNKPVYTASFYAFAIGFDPTGGNEPGYDNFLQTGLPDDFKIRTGKTWNLNHLDVGIGHVPGDGNMQYGCSRNFKINVKVWDR